MTRRNFQVVLKRGMRQGKWEAEKMEKHAILPTRFQDWGEANISWGEAIDVSIFYNRTHELAQLAQWIQHEGATST